MIRIFKGNPLAHQGCHALQLPLRRRLTVGEKHMVDDLRERAGKIFGR